MDVYVEEEEEDEEEGEEDVVKKENPDCRSNKKKKKRVIFEEPVFHYVTSDIRPDPYFDTFVNDQLALLGADYFDELALCNTELDGRFVSVRTRETGLGNLVCDASKFFFSLSLFLFLCISFT